MLIYGKNVAVEKLKTQDKINKIYLSTKFKDKEILDLIEKRNIKIKNRKNTCVRLLLIMYRSLFLP